MRRRVGFAILRAMTLIKNGFIVDGTGRPGFAGDVFVEGDRIVDVARATNGSDHLTCRGAANGSDHLTCRGVVNGSGPDSCRQTLTDANRPYSTIDATGCIVSPGFIDAHTHSDAYLVIEPDAPSKVTQGITTEINGQCGGSVAPRYGEARLSSDWAALLGDRLTWRSLAEYRDVLAAAKPAVNTVQFIGHNTLRSSVVGYAGRAATDDELREMERLLAESLDAGGWGLTTGLIYQPGKYSTPEEVVALAKIAAARGGFYATHMRSEGDRILEAIDEVIDLVKATGIRAEISHLKTSGRKNWHKIDAVLEKIEGAMSEGLLLGSDRYPYCAAGTDLDVVFPDWAGEGGCPAECERLADPATRAKIVDEINALDRDWSTVMIGGTWHPDTKRFSGKTVAEIISGKSTAGERQPDVVRRMSPGELICSILALDGCKTGGFFFGMSEENLDKILAKPWIVPGSDASLRAPWGPLGADHPHPRAYATMPEFYRRVRALGVSREEAVARMTSVIADRFAIPNRGRIAAGAFADCGRRRVEGRRVQGERDLRRSAPVHVGREVRDGQRRRSVRGRQVHRQPLGQIPRAFVYFSADPRRNCGIGVPLELQEILAHGDGDGLSAVGGADLLADGSDMLAYAFRTEPELLRDVAVSEASDHRLEYLALTRCQVRYRRIRRELLTYVGRYVVAALCDYSYCLGELRVVRILQYRTSGAGPQGVRYAVRGAVCRKKYGLDGRSLAEELLRGLDAVHLWHHQIHYDNVRVKLYRIGYGLRSVFCLADDFDVLLGSEKGCESSAHYGVVVCYQDLDFHLLSLLIGGMEIVAFAPSPGALSIVNSPSSDSMRSRMPRSP